MAELSPDKKKIEEKLKIEKFKAQFDAEEYRFVKKAKRITIMGPKGSGKTCFLIGLFTLFDRLVTNKIGEFSPSSRKHLNNLHIDYQNSDDDIGTTTIEFDIYLSLNVKNLLKRIELDFPNLKENDLDLLKEKRKLLPRQLYLRITDFQGRDLIKENLETIFVRILENSQMLFPLIDVYNLINIKGGRESLSDDDIETIKGMRNYYNVAIEIIMRRTNIKVLPVIYIFSKFDEIYNIDENWDMSDLRNIFGTYFSDIATTNFETTISYLPLNSTGGVERGEHRPLNPNILHYYKIFAKILLTFENVQFDKKTERYEEKLKNLKRELLSYIEILAGSPPTTVAKIIDVLKKLRIIRNDVEKIVYPTSEVYRREIISKLSLFRYILEQLQKIGENDKSPGYRYAKCLINHTDLENGLKEYICTNDECFLTLLSKGLNINLDSDIAQYLIENNEFEDFFIQNYADDILKPQFEENIKIELLKDHFFNWLLSDSDIKEVSTDTRKKTKKKSKKSKKKKSEIKEVVNDKKKLRSVFVQWLKDNDCFYEIDNDVLEIYTLEGLAIKINKFLSKWLDKRIKEEEIECKKCHELDEEFPLICKCGAFQVIPDINSKSQLKDHLQDLIQKKFLIFTEKNLIDNEQIQESISDCIDFFLYM